MLRMQKAHIEEEFETYGPHYLADLDDRQGHWFQSFPGEDIWMKFELLSTPPRSPSSPQPKTFIPTAADKLKMVLETSDSESAENGLEGDDDVFTYPGYPLIGSDCMWNGSSLTEKAKAPTVDNAHQYSTQGNSGNKQQQDTMVSYTAIQCINPSSVLPSVSPLTDHSHYVAQLPTPCSSVCSSESDEEIDVVTVENKPKKRLRSSELTITFQPASKRLRVTPPPTRPSSPVSTLQQLQKPRRDSQPRVCNSTSSLAGLRRISLRRSSSRNDDSDENEVDYKRTTHNVLERKRRNDLKSSFQILRMSVPDIKDNEKAPKVTILKKAGDYIREVRRNQDRLVAEVARQRQRQEALLKQYNALNQGAVSP